MKRNLFRTHTDAKDDYYRVMQRLTMAKKTSCTCDAHHVMRVLDLMSQLKVTEIDGPFGAVYSILAIMVRHAPIGYTFTATVDACLQDDFDPKKSKCVKYVYWVRYDINSIFSLSLCDTIEQENHTCKGVLACINNMDHIAVHTVNGHTLKNVHGQVRLLKIPGKIPESGLSTEAAASAPPVPPKRHTCHKHGSSAATFHQTSKTEDHIRNPNKGTGKFYTDEIKENFPILYDWLSRMDKIPVHSDEDTSEDEKPDFRYGIRHMNSSK